MRTAPMLARCLFVVNATTISILAQEPRVTVVATTSQGSVPAVASASLTYPSDHVREQPNALSLATIEMSQFAVPVVRDVQAFSVSSFPDIQVQASPVVLLVMRYADETKVVGFNLPAAVSREHPGGTRITPAPLSAATLSPTIADVTQRAGRRDAPTAIYLGIAVYDGTATPQRSLHLVRLDTGAER